MINYEKLKEYSPSITRISLSLVFLWFSVSQFINAEMWTGFLPNFLSSASNPQIFIYINASFELVFGIFMLLGIFTRLSAFLLSLHLFSICLALGYNAIAIRDLGLAFATFAVFMNGNDKLCLKKG